MKIIVFVLGILTCLLVASVTISGQGVPLTVSISLEKSTNSQDADTAPGPIIPVGDPVTWTYEVTNTGQAYLYNVELYDDELGFLYEFLALGPGDTGTIIAQSQATAGQYENTGTVVAYGDIDGDQIGDVRVEASDDSHYFGGDPGSEPTIPLLPTAAIPIATATITIITKKRRKK